MTNLGCPSCSNPHPVRRLGAILRKYAARRSSLGSNPHPVRRLGAIPFKLILGGFILFQSSPSPKTGRYHCRSRFGCWFGSSNPHPVRRLGAMPDWNVEAEQWKSSNPHPVRRLGAMKREIRAKPPICSNPHPVRRLGAIIHRA